jgi:transposase|tara:strand:+ start:71 stop:373 length:303 start_codon:yes stop_codon:yes gene_type:complete
MRRNFSQQFKEQAIAHVLDHPQEPMKALAQSLGVGYSTLDEWVRQHKRALGVATSGELSAEQQRVRALEREVRHLQEVNEILKKAHVYFVSNPSGPSTRS